MRKHFVIVFSVVVALSGCDSGPRAPQTWGADMSRKIPSPDGDHVLLIQGQSEQMNGDTWWHATVEILARDGTVLFSDNRGFATWFPLRFGWDNDNRLWCYSGDIGIHYWQSGTQGWRREQWQRESGLSIPAFLGLDKRAIQRRMERGF